MAKQSILLDPNAQAYSDDEIVGKVNAAAANITRANAVTSVAVDLSGKDTDDLAEGAGNKYDTGVPPADLEALPDGSTRKAMLVAEKTKLTGIEDGAEVNVGEEYTTTEATKLAGIEDGAKGDQTGAEIRDAVVALADVDRKIVITEPVSGEFKVISVQRDADAKVKISYDDVPEE